MYFRFSLPMYLFCCVVINIYFTTEVTNLHKSTQFITACVHIFISETSKYINGSTILITIKIELVHNFYCVDNSSSNI